MDKIVDIFWKIRCLIVSATKRLDWFPQALGRLAVGAVFVEAGWGKLHNLEKVVGFFRDLGIPAPELQAPFVATNELVCGTLLLVGLFTRLATVPIIASMVVAIITAKRAELQSITDIFSISEFLYIVVCLFLMWTGAGALSLDRVLMRKFGKEDLG